MHANKLIWLKVTERPLHLAAARWVPAALRGAALHPPGLRAGRGLSPPRRGPQTLEWDRGALRDRGPRAQRMGRGHRIWQPWSLPCRGGPACSVWVTSGSSRPVLLFPLILHLPAWCFWRICFLEAWQLSLVALGLLRVLSGHLELVVMYYCHEIIHFLFLVSNYYSP